MANSNATPKLNHSSTRVKVDWSSIDTLLLDMDGTLLDLSYDDQVWNQLLPRAYAQQHAMPVSAAQELLFAHMHKIQGTLAFYQTEYWVNYTQVDVMALHQQAAPYISYRADADTFLSWARTFDIRCVLVTNADRRSLAIKDRHCGLTKRLDRVVSSHDYGVPKEQQSFWQQLIQDQPDIDPNRSLMIDDNAAVLSAAQLFGIGDQLMVNKPNSRNPKRDNLPYTNFDQFAEIMC